eukprot:13083142-Heterocapsa_arctica.AAC.1
MRRPQPARSGPNARGPTDSEENCWPGASTQRSAEGEWPDTLRGEFAAGPLSQEGGSSAPAQLPLSSRAQRGPPRSEDLDASRGVRGEVDVAEAAEEARAELVFTGAAERFHGPRIAVAERA